jgi:pimeloyl-ACP methyl ester carboxylesterase
MVLVDSSHEKQNQQVPPEIAESPEWIKLQEGGATSLRILQIAAPIGVLRAFKLMDPAVANLQLPDQERGPALAEMYRTSFVGAYARESNMTATYSGQPRKLGDIPLIVLSQKMDLTDVQKMFESYPPAIRSLLTMEVMQRVADTNNENQNELAALSTRGKRIIVEGSGHFIQLDKPQVVIDAIREVFDQITK